MNTKLNRRNWLKSTTLVSTGIALGTTTLSSANRLQQKSNMSFWEWERSNTKVIDRSKLKARLLANENPYGPSDSARLAIMDAVSVGNRYGHGDAAKLKTLVAKKEGVPEEYVMLAPGSSELLEKVAVTQFMKGGNIVSADPAYMSLIKTAQAMKAEWKAIPLKDDWSHDLVAMEAAVDYKTKLVYICNPNNPTGTITDGKALMNFCSKVSEKVPVFVDEAYLEFMKAEDKMSMIGLLQKGKNIIISRTFSKAHGMAGIRVGYIVALPKTLDNIRKTFRSNMGLNITALKGAIASIQDQGFVEQCSVMNAEVRDYTMTKLTAMGFKPLPSQTSFILFPMSMSGQPFLDEMYGKGIGVRAFNIFDKDYCRVSIGTKSEMDLFLSAIKEVLV